MSDLTVALAGVGGLVLAGVIAHGAWQAWRAGPRKPTARKAAGRQEPVAGVAAPGEGSLEPTLGDVALRADAFGVAGEGVAEPGVVEPGLAEVDIAATRRRARRAVPPLDALIDAYVTFTLDAPVAADAVLAHWPAKRHVGSKTVLLEGRTSADAAWEAVHPDPAAAAVRYAELQAGVQLASRTGPLNEIEFSEFVQRCQALAEPIGASLDVPDMLEVMGRARELDAFASAHDAQLAVHLHARGAAWSVGYIQQHARRHGFVPGVIAGRLVLPSTEEGAPPVLTLTFDPQAALADEPDRAAVRDVTLAFDVPQTDPSVGPFAAWQASAQALAMGMEADVVDDDGRPLTTPGFEAIGGELGQLYDTLAARELAAGSAAARRLFS